MTVVSIPGWEPPARHDGTPWTRAVIGEAALESPTGPFTTIDTIALVPVDTDPANPQSRDFTTTNATLPAGWYQVTFQDAAGNSQPVPPVQYPPPAPETRPLLVPLDDLKRRLNVTRTSSDSDLERIIRGSTTVIERLTGKSFKLNPAQRSDSAVSVVVQLAGSPPPRSFMFGPAAFGTPLSAQPMAAEVPVTIPHASSLTTVAADGTALTSDQYLLENDSTLQDPYIRRVVILDPKVLPVQQLTVTGWFGIWPPPDDLVSMLLSWCARQYKERDASWGDSVQLPEGGLVTYYRSLPPFVRLVVDSYCEVTM